MQTVTKLRLRLAAVWLSRIIVGATFIISGWAKAVDPWGFLIKVNEYLTVWGMTLPREVVLTACVALACVEFCTGVLVASGCLKRFSTLTAAAMMAVMLPLTVYIAVDNPVSDCGCFGDFIILSNTATLIKNIVLSLLIAYLLKFNVTVRGLWPAPVQWLVITCSFAFPLFISFVGYHVQPVVDFRPYKLGTTIFETDGDAADNTLYIYEKDGVTEKFPLDQIPDSTWTFVDVEEDRGAVLTRGFEVRDRDGYDVSTELAAEKGPLLILVIAEPDMQFLSRAHYANRLSEYAAGHGVKMIGIAGIEGVSLDEWIELIRPHFEVYSAEDTALKQLVRGDAALVYTEDGIIRWKSNLNWMDAALLSHPDDANAFSSDTRSVDDGRVNVVSIVVYLTLLLIIYFLGQSPRMLRFFINIARKARRNKD